MRKFTSLFLYSVTLLALFVSITGVLAEVDSTARIFQILFIPVTIYLLLSSINHLINRGPVLDKMEGFRRILIYYCFVVTTTLVVISFLSSRSLPQVISSLIFSPLAFYFLLLIWPRANHALILPKVGSSKASDRDWKEVLTPHTKLDSNRRDFLKLIGTAGVLTFVFSLFSKRSVPFFSGVADIGAASLKDSGGNKIDPAEKSPTDGYYISEIDDGATIAYFGFLSRQGAWYIMRQDTDKAFRYVRGDRDFNSGWTDRESLNYDYFDNVF